MDMTEVINGLEARAAVAIKEAPGDYRKDGLLYCGKCHTAKQTRIDFMGEIKTPMCLCKCAADQRDKEFEEMKQKQLSLKIQKMRRMGFPDVEMQKWTFANDDGASAEIMGTAQRYVANFPEMKKRGKGLLLYGGVGRGKTFAASCIANALIDRGMPCMVTNFARLVNTLQGVYSGKQEYIDSLNDFDLLVIDDLASERDTEFMGEIVQNIIDSRYRAGLPLIVTTNLTSEELKNPADIRKQRIYSRLFEMCIPVEVLGQDRRRKRLRDDYSEFKELLGM